MSNVPRYDGLAEWYEEFRPALGDEELEALERLLGPGEGRCLDLGCGTGLPTAAVAALGWTVVGVDISSDLLGVARERGLEVLEANAEALPFNDSGFDAAISIWTHTDIDDFAAALTEVARVLRPGAPLVYIGAHPCFVGPHSLYVSAEGVPQLAEGYRRTGRYDGSAFGVGNPDGVRIRVGGVHLTLGALFDAFTSAGFVVERFEELARERDYPHALALRARAAT
jgi:SAM-dependent methyltransferase